MTDIFHEVEEDVRRERYEQIWKKYGNYIIALAVLIVIAAGAFQVWRTYDLNRRQEVSDRFQAAQQMAATGDAAQAETAFSAIVEDAPDGYATLAKFHLASAQLAQGKRDSALALLRELANDSDPVISSAARLKLAWTIADAAPRAEVVTTLGSLTAADSPWRFAAGEVLAYLNLKEGSRTQAQADYEKLAQDAAAPPSLRQRASALAEYLRANPAGSPVAAGNTASSAAPAATTSPQGTVAP